MLDEKALTAARRVMLQASRITFQRKRNPSQISEDLKLCWDASVAAGDALFPCSVNVRIGYRDFYGDDTLRDILVQSLFRFNGKNYINGYCFLRNDLRIFQVDRASSVTVKGLEAFNLTEGKCLFPVDFGISIIPDELRWTDFFVHPRAWGDYRRPLAILMGKANEQRLDSEQRFTILYQFVSESLRTGFWQDWYFDQKAASLCLPALRLCTGNLNWQRELDEVQGGRFSRAALRSSIDSI
jgi:hypothetical protein